MQRAALVVASSNYDDTSLQELEGPAADAAALAEVLGDAAIGGFEVELLEDQPSYDVNRRIARFFSADRSRDDVLLLYFSGHGIKDDQGRLYFAMRDTDRTVPEATAVSAAFVNDVMQRSRARAQVLLLDCCFSGAFASGFAPKAGNATADVAERFVAPSGTGRVVLTASDALQYAFEGDTATGEGIGSVFTRFLVEGLRTGEADLDGDGEVGVTELYDYLYQQVSATLPSQSPEKWEWGLQGRLVIARTPQSKPVAFAPEVQEALDSPLPDVRLVGVEQLGRLAAGARPRLAEAARAALTARLGDDSQRVQDAARAALAAAPPEPTEPAPAPPAQAPEPRRSPPSREPSSPSGLARLLRDRRARLIGAAALAVVTVLAIVAASVGGGDDGGDDGGDVEAIDTVVPDDGRPTDDLQMDLEGEYDVVEWQTWGSDIYLDEARVEEELLDPHWGKLHAFDLVGTGVVTVTPEDGDLDTYLQVFDQYGNQVDTQDAGPGESESVYVDAGSGERFIAEVSSADGSTIGPYAIELTSG